MICSGCLKEFFPKTNKRKHPNTCRSCLGRMCAITKHGRTVIEGKKGVLYSKWQGMRDRCNCPTNKDYVRYGAKGIRVTPMWNDYASFENWALSKGYEHGDTIERKNKVLDYHPNNCRLIKRKTKYEVNGELLTAEQIKAQLAKSNIVISYSVIRKRLNRGWSWEKATNMPLMANASTLEKDTARSKIIKLKRGESGLFTADGKYIPTMRSRNADKVYKQGSERTPSIEENSDTQEGDDQAV
jgi:hypothetical protein